LPVSVIEHISHLNELSVSPPNGGLKHSPSSGCGLGVSIIQWKVQNKGETMAKNIKSHKASKGNKEHKEFKGSPTMTLQNRKSGQGDGFSKEVDKRQKGQENWSVDSQNSQKGYISEAQDSQGIELPEITTPKSGCLSKLFLFLLPILAFGTFLFLRS